MKKFVSVITKGTLAISASLSIILAPAIIGVTILCVVWHNNCPLF